MLHERIGIANSHKQLRICAEGQTWLLVDWKQIFSLKKLFSLKQFHSAIAKIQSIYTRDQTVD